MLGWCARTSRWAIGRQNVSPVTGGRQPDTSGAGLAGIPGRRRAVRRRGRTGLSLLRRFLNVPSLFLDAAAVIFSMRSV